MITIRRYNPGEEAGIQKLINEIMVKEFGEDRAAYPTGDLESLTTSYGALGEAFFVAVDQSKIVGTVAIKKEDDRVALMRRLFVDNTYRRRNIGVQLLDRVIQFCHEVGYDEVIFKTTSKMISANELCKKRGFLQRAKLQLGPVELFKFSLSLRNGLKAGTAKSSA